MGTTVSEITDRKIDGDVLHLQTYSEDRLGDKEKLYVIETSSADQKERSLQLDTGEVLYPITVDDAVETGFGHISEMLDLLGELRDL